MKKQLTAADFTADQSGEYSSPLTSYTVVDQLHSYYEACKADGRDAGNPMPSLLLMAYDEDGYGIDAGLFHSWEDVLAVLNYSILSDNYTAAAVAVYDNPSNDPVQRAADLETFAALRRELDRLTPLSQFMR